MMTSGAGCKVTQEKASLAALSEHGSVIGRRRGIDKACSSSDPGGEYRKEKLAVA
jgi:hypothetical protein